MTRFLFVTWDGGGNVAPAVEIARELQHRGDQVGFLGQEQQREALVRAGFEFDAYGSPGSWTASGRGGALKNALGFLALLTGRSLGRDLIMTIDESPTDMVVIDCLLFGVLDAASRARVRHTVLVHSFYEAIDKKMAGGAPGAVAKLVGLNPRKLWAKADLMVVATLEELDHRPHPKSRISVAYSGPTLPEIRETDRPSAIPTILVSLSTTYIPGQGKVLQNILDALADLPVRALVTTGPAVDPAEVHAPPNSEVHRYLPHAEIMSDVSLVIGHGGHSTTMLALAHGLPLLILPMNPAFDQAIVGIAIQAKGAGLTLSSGSSMGEIRHATERMLASETFSREAERLGVAIRATRGTETAADLLQALEQQDPAHHKRGLQH